MEPHMPWAVIIGVSALLIMIFLFPSRERDQFDRKRDELMPSMRLATSQAHNVLVQDIMSKDLITIAPGDSARSAWRTLHANRVKTLPVVKEERVVGIVAMVDILRHLGLSGNALPADLSARVNTVMEQQVTEVMSQPVRTVPADMSLDRLVPLLCDTSLRHLPVVDELGKLVGIVTRSDLIAALAHLVATHAPLLGQSEIRWE